MDTNHDSDDAISESGIRGGDRKSLAAFFRLFDPIVRKQARLLGVDAGDIDDVTTEFLDDILLELVAQKAFPSELGAYVSSAFRHHAVRFLRERRKRSNDLQIIAEELSSAGSCAGAECIARLCAIASQGLSESDRQLVMYVSARTPPRDVARYLRIERSAAKVRMHRMKGRLRKLMLQSLDCLSAEDRRDAERILRRADALAPETGEDI